MRVRIAAFLSSCALLLAGATAHADGRWTTDDTFAALAGRSPLDACIVRLESDEYDPYSVGRQGELGIVQLHPRGLLADFYADGYTDPFSPYQSLDYLDRALAEGKGPQWSSWWHCR